MVGKYHWSSPSSQAGRSSLQRPGELDRSVPAWLAKLRPSGHPANFHRHTRGFGFFAEELLEMAYRYGNELSSGGFGRILRRILCQRSRARIDARLCPARRECNAKRQDHCRINLVWCRINPRGPCGGGWTNHLWLGYRHLFQIGRRGIRKPFDLGRCGL